MKGILFGEKHSYNDFGLILSSKVISPPIPKLKKIENPFGNGDIDLTNALTGEVYYQDRLLTFTFTVLNCTDVWLSAYSKILNEIQGKKVKIVLDTDSGFYYFGRVVVDEFQSDSRIGMIIINCDVEPYKYDIQSSSENWLWDSFNFETGIINELKDLAVDGSRVVQMVGRAKNTVPIITSDADMTATFNSKTYAIVAGKNKVLDIQIKEGINKLVFEGIGVVSIDYRGGSL